MRSRVATAISPVEARPQTIPYLSRPRLSSVLVVGAPVGAVGGAWARRRYGVCPRTPRLTSVLDPGWLRVGYMMCDGGFGQMVLRPLILSGPFPRRGRR